MVVNEEDDGEEQGGSTNAYLEAISGEDGFRRTSKGALRANKKRSRQEQDDDRSVNSLSSIEAVGLTHIWIRQMG